MQKRYLLRWCWRVLGFVALGVVVQQTFFDIIWFDREELLGVRLGVHKQDVVKLLSQHGVDYVHPRLTHEVVIENVNQLGKLNDATGICVNDYRNDSKGLQVSFDSDGHVILVHESVHKVAELSGVKTRSELIAKLRLMIGQSNGLEVYTCIPEARWVRIKDGIMDDDVEFLLKYDVWLFDMPGSYSGARFQFDDDGKLSKIKYRWQLFESL